MAGRTCSCETLFSVPSPASLPRSSGALIKSTCNRARSNPDRSRQANSIQFAALRCLSGRSRLLVCRVWTRGNRFHWLLWKLRQTKSSFATMSDTDQAGRPTAMEPFAYTAHAVQEQRPRERAGSNSSASSATTTASTKSHDQFVFSPHQTPASEKEPFFSHREFSSLHHPRSHSKYRIQILSSGRQSKHDPQGSSS